MAKKAKITAANIIKAMGLEDEKKIILACGMNEDTVEISVKPRLSLPERANMIQDILSMVFITSPDGADVYHPEFKKFAFEYEIVNYFTDISLPVNSDKAWEFLERTGIASRIANTVRDGYVGEIIAEASEMIEYRKQELLKRSKLDQVLDGLVDVLGAAQSKTENLDLGQIIAYAQENAPELKEKLDALLRSEIAEAPAD
jgi:hypothetical protein